MSLKERCDSNAAGARNGKVIPMRDEPERGKLLMNAHQHEGSGEAQPERDKGSAGREPQDRMDKRRHRSKVQLHQRRSETARLQQTRQAGAWRGEAVSIEGGGPQPGADDAAGRPVDGASKHQTQARTQTELC
jgi:hypothetical protein